MKRVLARWQRRALYELGLWILAKIRLPWVLLRNVATWGVILSTKSLWTWPLVTLSALCMT